MFATNIPLYGIIILLAIISGLVVILKNVKKANYKTEEIIILIMYILLGTMFGAKYFSYFTNPQKYNGIFQFSKIGLSSYGAVIGILIMLFIFSKQLKRTFKEMIYIILPAIPLMYGIGKIGCFLSGCCYGIKYNGIFHITYNYSLSASKNVNLFPIQLLESIVFIAIFIWSSNKIKKEKNQSKIIGQIFIVCGISKFLLDFLRMSHVNKILSTNQIISIIFILLGVYLILKQKNKKRENHF